MKDITGIEINIGDTVKTTQPSGGILPPGSPQIGIVEETVNVWGDKILQIRFRKGNDPFDRFIHLPYKINEIVKP